ncbi:magnesium transporter CorA family protein [Alishewanella sp. SMS8]|uniref:magnesium transporter CorA family protein n=1 Tax=Alishewanella sp. SMS8 TaxID=2994676 RepID=UPI0027425FF3|nr:magnesium transporter CorA family protein [Alishewanella sp. SMS8]MDP5458303.1 magnesium transporter CorA family protein [Alishewanella sp. SMS8]
MITLCFFDHESTTWQQRKLKALSDGFQFTSPIWIDLSEASSEEELHVMQKLAIAPTMLEDFTRQRHPPKFEAQDDFSLLILRGYADPDFSELTESAQVNVLFSRDILISKIQCHDPILASQLQPQLAEKKNATVSDWVKQVILAVSASYLGKLLIFEDELSELEDVMLQKGDDELMSTMMRYRSVLRKVSRNLAYQKDIFAEASYEELHPMSKMFLSTDVRDFYEKFERLHSMTDMYYDQLSDLVHGYMSTTSHQINERMKVLTMVSTIFIPLTFIAGIYGMNFANMPELMYKNGYFIALIVMFFVGLGSLIWFKFKNWW